jgi:hypothetical protein
VQPIPRSVRVASLLLFGCAALAALDALTSGLAMVHLSNATSAYINSAAQLGDAVSNVRSSYLYNIVVGLAVGLVFCRLAMAVRRPSNRARIIACWATAAVVALFGCGIATGPEADVSPTGNESPTVRHALDHLIPVWYTAVHGVIVAAVFAGMIAVAIQLMRSSARDFHDQHDGTAAGLWTFISRTGDGL